MRRCWITAVIQCLFSARFRFDVAYQNNNNYRFVFLNLWKACYNNNNMCTCTSLLWRFKRTRSSTETDCTHYCSNGMKDSYNYYPAVTTSAGLIIIKLLKLLYFREYARHHHSFRYPRVLSSLWLYRWPAEAITEETKIN